MPISSSKPFGSTFNDLIVSWLQNPTDYFSDKINQNKPVMRTKWEGPFIYEPPNGDLKKDWFVWFKYEHPVTGKYERFRFNKGFNKYKTKTERREHGILFRNVIDKLLSNGFSPYGEYNPLDNLLNKQKTVVTCIDKYLVEVKPYLRPKSYDKYSFQLKVFKKWLIENNLSHLLINDVRKATVLEFLTETREKRKWGGKTYNHYLVDITTFFNYFHKNYDDYVDKVPTLHLKKAISDKPGNTAFSDWQFKKLKDMMLENGDTFLYTCCSFIYYGALRSVSEVNKIKIGDFNFNQKTLKVLSGTAKNRQTEFIPIYPDFLDLLYELGIHEMSPDNYVFAREGKRAYIGGPTRIGDDYIRRAFQPYKLALKLGKRDGPYCYKHTRAIHLGEDGEDLYKIMRLFRHKDLATTMIYLRDLGINTSGAEFKKGRKF